MATVNITISSSLNTSLQIGDVVYYVSTTETSGFDVGSNMVEVGVVTAINQSSNIVTCDIVDGSPVPTTTNTFYMFSKDNRANMASPLGYYAEAKFVSDSKTKSEIFATACDVTVSSK
jgi:hypothetical protein